MTPSQPNEERPKARPANQAQIEEAWHIRHTVVVHCSELTRRGNIAVPCGQVLIGGVCPIHGARHS